MTPVRIAPSILAADLLRLGEQVEAVERGDADRIHLDVMDGVFVPNISFGLPIAQAVRRVTQLPLEAHLMIVQPERYVEAFAEAGCDTIIVHQEVSPHLDRTLRHIRKLGRRAGVVINPGTPVSTLDEVLELLDLALVMTVNPGFGGQHFIETTLRKIARLRQMLDEANPACEIEVDGGIDLHTIAAAYAAGARVFVAGTSVFGHPDGPEAGIAGLIRGGGVIGDPPSHCRQPYQNTAYTTSPASTPTAANARRRPTSVSRESSRGFDCRQTSLRRARKGQHQ